MIVLTAAGIVCLVGLVMYLVSAQSKAQNVGLVMFAVGLFQVLARLDAHLLVR